MAKLVKEQMEHGLHKQFDAVASKKKFNPNDVEAARSFFGAYVEYVHYVEGLHNAAGPASPSMRVMRRWLQRRRLPPNRRVINTDAEVSPAIEAGQGADAAGTQNPVM